MTPTIVATILSLFEPDLISTASNSLMAIDVAGFMIVLGVLLFGKI
ncbi:hypothetical protein [Methylocystis sp. JR02]|nr:hypothetical protein [Methylocystis sp. JR02]MDJ0450809.1 hypothetical protein [Methylocystis sp. JR02]